MRKTNTLISTKLRLPFTRQELVDRPRLQKMILHGLNGPLTLITAPAGFGKTTLAAACIANCGMPAAWLSLDKEDNQVERFLAYLIAALQEADPAIGKEAAQLVMGIHPANPEVVLTYLINELDASDSQVVLVLDDYQVISNQAVHEALSTLIDRCPKTLHLVIATRSDPPLPAARLRARGQMVELRVTDLRFTEPEASQFFSKVMGMNLDAGSVAALEERTEGWAVGLQMAALSLRDQEDISGFIASFSGTNRYILDYLLEEVLASQPPDIQQFLLHTSILERMNAALCEALCEKSEWGVESGDGAAYSTFDTQALLDYLDRRNLFVVPLDEYRRWYRYHHLFADLLRARLLQSQADLAPILHVRASAWFERNGLFPEAIQHLFSAQEIHRAANLIEHYGLAGLAGGDPSVIRMAESLPPDLLLTHPRTGLCQAWLLIIKGRIKEALPLLQKMELQLAGSDQEQGSLWMLATIKSAQAFLSPPPGSAGFTPLPDYQLLEEIPAGELVLRNAADFLYGMALARQGEMERATELAARCIEREKKFQGSLAIPTLAPFLSRILLMQGRLHAAAALCHEFLDPLVESDKRFIYTSGSMKVDLGEVLYEWNNLEEAEGNIREGLQANEPWRNIMTDGFGLAILARLLQAKGDHHGALEAVARLERRLLEYARPPREFDEDLHTLKIHLQLASGNKREPAQWAEQVQLSEDYDLHPERYRLVLGRLRLLEGRFAEVEKLLDGTAPPFSAGSAVSRQLETKLLLAAAAAGQGRLLEALELVEACLALAEPEGYTRIFIDAGEPARSLLNTYLGTAAPVHGAYARKILGVFSQESLRKRGGSQPGGLLDPLTERELEVLGRISLGRTNQEIARELVVATGTVKAHTASIYRKLEAANRTDAVRRAREMGILR